MAGGAVTSPWNGHVAYTTSVSEKGARTLFYKWWLGSSDSLNDGDL